MDELDEQLRQLSLINSRLSLPDANNGTLSDNHIDVSKLVNSIEENNKLELESQVALQNRLIAGHDLNAIKKVGPLVPPKPLKKSSNFPEISAGSDGVQPHLSNDDPGGSGPPKKILKQTNNENLNANTAKTPMNVEDFERFAVSQINANNTTDNNKEDNGVTEMITEEAEDDTQYTSFDMPTEYDEEHKGPFVVYVDTKLAEPRKPINQFRLTNILIDLKVENIGSVLKIPQSSLVKQTCEPLYSQRLQSADGGSNCASSEFSKEPLLLRKQHTYNTQQLSAGTGSINRKVTLDNPAILEQQLEALEHHKKQLEKRGKLCKNSTSNNSNKNVLQSFNHRSKLLSSSLITDVRTKLQNTSANTHLTYSNLNNPLSGRVGVGNSRNNLYCNLVSTPLSSINNIYSNVAYDKAEQLGDCTSHSQPQASKTKLTSTVADESSVYFSENGSITGEEEIPPPPSPVSSSYSELRRATEVFKTKHASTNNDIKASDQIILTKPIIGYDIHHDHILSKASNESHQLYMNKPYTTNEVLNNQNITAQTKANPNSSDYFGYGGFSQTSSAYESIYEPINPRPTSQMSSRSHNLGYPTDVNSSSSGIPILPECGGALGKSSSSNFSTLSGLSGVSSTDSNSPIYPNNTSSGSEVIVNKYTDNPKESEVESLTDFLVSSMDTHQDLETYGICFKCNERVVGENSGCTAMDQVYHIDCFTCSQCQINLQGKPFYALDCKPYCDFDYLQTLEKCSVCVKPILERILRATGKPYHPQCFTCVVCKKSLDGIPFTVDATNQNYCIEDFHKKFAPRCCVCKKPIMPEPGEEETVRVVALDRSFHFECYKCEDCGLLLSSEAEGRGCYPLDDHVLCKSCNAKRVQMLTNRMTTTEL